MMACSGTSADSENIGEFISNYQRDSIIIYNQVPKNKIITWQIFDEYGDTEPPIEFTNKNVDSQLKWITGQTTKFITIDLDNRKSFMERESFTEFLLYPNESLIAYKDEEGFTRLKNVNDSIRTNELNFMVNLKKNVGEISGFRGVFPVKISINEQVKLATERSKNAIEYLRNYEKTKIINNKFKNYITNFFKYDIIYYRMRNYFSPFIPEKYKINFNHSLVPAYDTLSKEFKCDECMDIDNYKISALLYTNYLCYKKGIKSSVFTLYKLANENFENKTRDYLLFKIVKNQMDKNAQENGFKLLINKFYIDCKNEKYVSYIRKNTSLLEVSETSLNNFKSSILLKTNSNKITVNDLIEASKAKVIYIDLWASWCSPCIAEMPASQQLQKSYANKGINFAYISLDKNRIAWEKSMSRIGINPQANSYLLVNDFESGFAKEFKISSIPRYILIGKDGLCCMNPP